MGSHAKSVRTRVGQSWKADGLGTCAPVGWDLDGPHGVGFRSCGHSFSGGAARVMMMTTMLLATLALEVHCTPAKRRKAHHVGRRQDRNKSQTHTHTQDTTEGVGWKQRSQLSDWVYGSSPSNNKCRKAQHLACFPSFPIRQPPSLPLSAITQSHSRLTSTAVCGVCNCWR